MRQHLQFCDTGGTKFRCGCEDLANTYFCVRLNPFLTAASGNHDEKVHNLFKRFKTSFKIATQQQQQRQQ